MRATLRESDSLRVALTDIGNARRVRRLVQPAGWFRLADSAEAWGFRQTLRGRVLRDRAELARAWWHEEVRPVVERVRNRESVAVPREIAVYVSYGLDHV